MNSYLISDTRGKKSWHLSLGILWTTLFTVKCLLSGLSVTLPVLGAYTIASVPGAEYMLYITPWLAAMGTREWIEKKTNGNST